LKTSKKSNNNNHAKILRQGLPRGDHLSFESPDQDNGHSSAPQTTLDQLKPIAEQFAISGPISSITPLGSGNVNQTFLVVCEAEKPKRYVLQQINTTVFPKPELLMQNMTRLGSHAESTPLQEDWVVPKAIKTRASESSWLEHKGQFWRLITFVENATTLQTISTPAEAREVGRALGLFHRLISTIPLEDLSDTLPGFHVTPSYLEAYEVALQKARNTQTDSLPIELETCIQFVKDRAEDVDVLEAAHRRGELQTKPIHGDPKVNNIMLCCHTARAIAMVDLDTIKPGLLHYDIGDCCRSACNMLGEETEHIESVSFDIQLCEAILDGYIESNRDTLKAKDFDYIYEAIRLITFELGLRFLTDHLAGNVYFKVNRPGHNLHRARIQFKLTESIEEQAESIQAIIARLR
jgi:Ser/Thr protein kinase RdoA (MazF antagonist)